MSNVSSFHQFRAYTGKESALAEQRLVKVTFKTDKETGVKPDSKCVSVPQVSTFAAEIIDNWSLVEKHIFSFFEGVQNSIVRTKVEAGASGVTDNDIGLFACLAHLEQEQVSGRLSKAVLTEWFEDEVEPTLTMVLAEKLGVVNNAPTAQQTKVIETTVKRFEGWITAMAGAKTLLPQNAIDQVRKVLDLMSADSIAEKLQAKLKFMEEQNSLFDDGLAL